MKIKNKQTTNLADLLDFEHGVLSEVETIRLFSALLKNKMVWKLQGFYGRTASDMITSGILNSKGDILINLNEVH
jgi:hypothetical protein